MAPGRLKKPTDAEIAERKVVSINAETVTNTVSTDFPDHWPGEDHAWDLDEFKRRFIVRFHQNQPLEASFSLIGIDASIANAFRRILLAEVPTVAIEEVFIYNNTSIVQDEVLAHRLGLVPLAGHPAGFKAMDWYIKPEGDEPSNGNDLNIIQMELKIKCERREGVAKGEDDPLKLYKNAHVYAKDMAWVPVGRQTTLFPPPDCGVRPVNPDILLAKLRPGQEINLEMHCIKGIGADHAKFSPVATATYRLLPTITITKPILGADAEKFAGCFPKGVISIETVTSDDVIRDPSFDGHIGEPKAVVKNAFRDTVSRECLRHDEFVGKVKLGRQQDHFIFNIESTGQYESDDLFLESVKLLKAKCSMLKRDLTNLMR